MIESIYKTALAKTIETIDGRDISIIMWIQQQIDASPDNTIRMRLTDIKKALGPEFDNKSYSVIFYVLKRTLAHYDIDIRSRTHKKDDSQVFMMLPKYYATGHYENALINNIVTTENGDYVSILEWIKQHIGTNREFTIDVSYMKKILGQEFVKKSDDTFCVSIRNTLKKYDIIVKRQMQQDGKIKLLVSPLPSYHYQDARTYI